MVVRAVIRRVSRVASVSCCVLGGNKEKGCCYLTHRLVESFELTKEKVTPLIIKMILLS